jgi:N-formylglutamate amidohydrolase
MADSPAKRSTTGRQHGGSIPGVPGEAAFALSLGEGAPVPVLLAVPHAGRSYPPELLTRMRHPAAAGLRLEDRFVDLVAEAVARETGAALLVAHAPRAMIDLNRAPDDIDWEMVADAAPQRRTKHSAGRRARSGLGLVPRRLPGLGELWKHRLSEAELGARLEQVHKPYHAALGRTLERLRDKWGAALLIDLHSMPPLGPKRGTEPAPDFVIGDRFGSSSEAALTAAAFDHFAAAGRSAAHNRPYAGGYVLDRHASPARGIHALQVEMCRAAYLDSQLSEPGPGMAAIVRVLAGLVRRMAQEIALSRGLPQAAE